MNRMLVSATVAANATRVNDPGIERAMRERSGFIVTDPANGTVKSFLFADLRDPSTASDMSLVVELTYSDAILNRKLEDLLILHLLIALIAIGMGMGLAWGTTRFLTKPIEGIIEDVDTIARGELDHPIREGLTPEFARLRESITLMISRILHFSGELERGKAELRIASTIQLSFLPKIIPEIEGFVLAAASIPAKEVGGDFYDIIDLGPGRTGLVIADVSGKGVPAALFMVFSRTTVRASTQMLGMVAGAVASANRMISADADLGMFVTLAYGVLDAHSRRFTYANAGHNPPLHYVAATKGIRMLYPTGIVLGVDGDEEYGEETVSLAPGDLLVFYTDGVTEAENSSHELFGEERLIGVVSRYAHLSPDELIGRIREEIVSFASGAPQSDDITLMVLRAG
jgi:serine phosphatase RsbU (regulator of sigma subunit)